MKLTLTLDGVTYGDLYDYVDAVRAAGVPREEHVNCVGSDDRGDRFDIDLGPDCRESTTAADVASVLSGNSDPTDGANRRSDGTEGQSSSGEKGRGDGPRVPTAFRDALLGIVRSDSDVDKVIAIARDMSRFLR